MQPNVMRDQVIRDRLGHLQHTLQVAHSGGRFAQALRAHTQHSAHAMLRPNPSHLHHTLLGKQNYLN